MKEILVKAAKKMVGRTKGEKPKKRRYGGGKRKCKTWQAENGKLQKIKQENNQKTVETTEGSN